MNRPWEADPSAPFVRRQLVVIPGIMLSTAKADIPDA